MTIGRKLLIYGAGPFVVAYLVIEILKFADWLYGFTF